MYRVFGLSDFVGVCVGSGYFFVCGVGYNVFLLSVEWVGCFVEVGNGSFVLMVCLNGGYVKDVLCDVFWFWGGGVNILCLDVLIGVGNVLVIDDGMRVMFIICIFWEINMYNGFRDGYVFVVWWYW